VGSLTLKYNWSVPAIPAGGPETSYMGHSQAGGELWSPWRSQKGAFTCTYMDPYLRFTCNLAQTTSESGLLSLANPPEH